MKYSIANQVLAFAVLEGPKKSWDLRRAVMGVRYASASKNNNNYNRHRKAALKANILTQEGKFFSLGEEGKKLVTWAKEEGIDLSLVQTDQQKDWEMMNPIEAEEGACDKCNLVGVDHSHASITG